MKWFKHISDSLDDPFIFDLMDRFGDFGYLGFFGILEIYAREFKAVDGWLLDVSLKFVAEKLHKKTVKQTTNLLQSRLIQKKWRVKIDGDRLQLFIPKFWELLDESTKKKLRERASFSGNLPETFRNDPPTDRDRDRDRDKRTNPAATAAPDGVPFPDKKSSNHYSKIVGKYVAEIDAVSLEVSRRFPQKKMNPFQFAQRAANENQHPQAIIDSLRAVVEQKVKQPWAYARAVLKTKSQNYREQEFQAEAAAFKETYTAPEKLKAILATIGKEPKK
jgi:hypothetical protein